MNSDNGAKTACPSPGDHGPDDDLCVCLLLERQASDDERVQRSINEAVGLMAGSGLALAGLLALVWAFAGFAVALLALMACFATLALLVGYDRLHGLTRTW